MAQKTLTRTQKALVLVPVALLSGAWTANLAAFATGSSAGDDGPGALPDGTSVPSQAIKSPANVSTPGAIAPGVPDGDADAVIDGASASGIPSTALAAYQRAAQIIDSADTSCHLPWELVAAIGRVESDHGRYNGSVLDAQGVSVPSIFGIPLDGTGGTQKVADTDAGQLDQDPTFDRAVGPMQFIPSTWQIVKVDADGDGKRDPQNINDAALATAVYLCSGDDNLTSTAGQKAAVYRYNHSQAYVSLVLALMKAYQLGDYTAVPDGTTGGEFLSDTYSYPSPDYTKFPPLSSNAGTLTGPFYYGGGSGAGTSGSTSGTGTGAAGTTGSAQPAATAPASAPASSDPATPTTPKPTPAPSKPVKTPAPKPVEGAQAAASAAAQAVPKTLAELGKAVEYCTQHLPPANQFLLPGTFSTALNNCVTQVATKTLAQADASINDIVSGVLAALGLGSLLG